MSGRSRRVKARAFVMSAGDLKITIATSPTVSGSRVSVENDVRLVRSALLYADSVELISPSALMIASLAVAASQGTQFLFDLIDNMDDETLASLGWDDVATQRKMMTAALAMYRMPRADRRKAFGPGKDKEFRAEMQTLLEVFTHGAQSFSKIAEGMWQRAGAPDLSVAMERGVLTLSTDAFDPAADQMMEQYADTLKRLVEDPSNHLMFDESVGNLVRAMVREGKARLDPIAGQHTSRAITGTGLIEHLPAFSESGIESIIDTREELAEPLVRYRKSIVGFSEKLHSGPLDAALRAEVEDLWRDNVQPTLAELRHDLSSTKLVKDVSLSLLADAKAVVSGAVGLGVYFGVGAMADLPQLGALGSLAALPVAQSAAQAARQPLRDRADARRHGLYYLLAANKQLHADKP